MTSPADDFVENDAKSSSDLCTEGARQRGLHGFEAMSAVSSLKYSSGSFLFQNKNNHFYASSERTQI